jgi:hypothetical protein
VPIYAKVIGYFGAGICALSIFPALDDLNFGLAVALLTLAVTLVLACNPFGLRADLPWLGDENKTKAFAGWAAFIVGGMVLAALVGAATNAIPAVAQANDDKHAASTATADTRALSGTATAQVGVAAATTTAETRSQIDMATAQASTATAQARQDASTATAETRAHSGTATAVAVATAQVEAAVARTSTASAPTATSVPPTPTPVPPTPTPAPGVGTTVTSGNWSYTVTRVTMPGKNINTGNQFAELNALGSWVAVYLTLKNVGSQNYSINQWDFELRVASPPSTYQVTDESVAMNIWLDRNGLQSLGKQIPPGVSFNTGLLFDVAPDSSGTALHILMGNIYIDLESTATTGTTSAAIAQPGPGAPAAAAARPSLADVGLVSSTVPQGLPVSLTYKIVNPGPSSIPIVLGASIRPSGTTQWIDDPANDKTVNVAPGTGTFSRIFQVSADAPTGAYDVSWGLIGTDMKTSYGLETKPRALTVTSARR